MNYLIYGNEDYLLKKELNKILAENDPTGSTMDTIVHDGLDSSFSIRNVLEDCDMLPFLNDKKTVVIQNPSFLGTQKSLNEEEIKLFEKYLKNSSHTTDLVLIGDISLDKRKKIVKIIQENARCYQHDHLSLQDFHTYVLKELKLKKINITSKAKEELFKRLPSDLQNFHTELEKMSLYGDILDEEGVSSLITRPLDEDVFLLVNSVVSKNMQAALHLWNDLFILNKDPIYLVALLASQFRLLYQVRVYLDMGYKEKEIQKECKVHPYRITKAIESLRGLSKERCLEILDALANLDQSFKSGTVDKKIGFELFLIRIAR